MLAVLRVEGRVHESGLRFSTRAPPYKSLWQVPEEQSGGSTRSKVGVLSSLMCGGKRQIDFGRPRKASMCSCSLECIGVVTSKGQVQRKPTWRGGVRASALLSGGNPACAFAVAKPLQHEVVDPCGRSQAVREIASSLECCSRLRSSTSGRGTH